MSVVRLGAIALAMAGAAIALLLLAADPAAAVRTVVRASEVTAQGRPESVVLAVTGLLAWATWAWGALGLVLTAASGLPGLPGVVTRTVSRALLPERMRAAAALALGMSLVMAGPAAAAPPSPPGPPDWPTAATGSPGPPDWPADPADDAAAPAETVEHLVRPGDCLWRIAEDRLDDSGTTPTDAEVARAVAAWWAANADVIGPDPDLVHPGQVLQAPPAGPAPAGGTR